MVSLHGNVYNYYIDSEVRPSNSETLVFGYAKASYHLFNGVYVGGLYQTTTDDENKKNTFGLNLSYVYKIFHVSAAYLFHSNHKYKTDTINAELEKGSGFLIDTSVNFPLSWNFYIGLGLSYYNLKYDEVDYEAVAATNSSVRDKESYFMPMIQLTYFFRTHGKRVHERQGYEDNSKPSLKKVRKFKH